MPPGALSGNMRWYWGPSSRVSGRKVPRTLSLCLHRLYHHLGCDIAAEHSDDAWDGWLMAAEEFVGSGVDLHGLPVID